MDRGSRDLVRGRPRGWDCQCAGGRVLGAGRVRNRVIQQTFPTQNEKKNLLKNGQQFPRHRQPLVRRRPERPLRQGVLPGDERGGGRGGVLLGHRRQQRARQALVKREPHGIPRLLQRKGPGMSSWRLKSRFCQRQKSLTRQGKHGYVLRYYRGIVFLPIITRQYFFLSF